MLVVLVVFIFLHSLRLTIIPTLAVPVSILGTFGHVALGFSINMLTLFGMILAIGLVVDDAIVVVGEHRAQHGAVRADAVGGRQARDGRRSAGPVVAVVLVLNAVFIPVAFLGGITGAAGTSSSRSRSRSRWSSPASSR